MLRLPPFRYVAPRSVEEAAAILASEGPGATLMAGGTDLIPNMKRRQQVPAVLVGLRGIEELRGAREEDEGMTLGAGMSLTAVAEDARVRAWYPGVWQAVSQIATPHLRNMGTLGGNLCLDTRCNYYDQTYEWRKAIGFCMKKDGRICWVAPGSSRCLAVSSTDGAPALVALGARVRLVSASGAREIPLEQMYRNDGIQPLRLKPGEILTRVVLDSPTGWRSAYWKLRRRGSFDFPVLSVAAAARFDPEGKVEAARVVLGAVLSRPLPVPEAGARLVGTAMDDPAIAEAARAAAKPAKPMDNTDFTLHWRKHMTERMATWALRELRGDDVSEIRRRIAHRTLVPLP